MGNEKKMLSFSWVVLVDLAVNTAHEALFTHAGQVCFAASRIFVHSNIHDEFVQRSVELAKQRIVGDPFDPSTQQGPLVESADQRVDRMKRRLRFPRLAKNNWNEYWNTFVWAPRQVPNWNVAG